MKYVVSTAPTSEPLTVAEVKKHCRIDAGDAEPAPGALTAALAGAGAGNVDNGAHRYRVTFVTSDGETEGGTVSAAVTVADKTVNGKVSLSAIPLGGADVTSRKIYRTAAGGSTYLLLATLADNTTTTYTDNTADSSLGAGAPTTNTTLDPLIVRMIQSARELCEHETGRALMPQTLTGYLDCFPCEIEIPVAPITAVTGIEYYDANNTLTTLSTDVYDTDIIGLEGRITLKQGQCWPTTRVRTNAVRVTWTAGYASAAAIPASLRDWMLAAINAAWDNRSAAADAKIEANPFMAGLLDPHRIIRV